MDLVCYPKNFLMRPEDRLMLSELKEAGYPDAAAGYMLYRIWAEFAMGDSARRSLGPDDSSAERVIRAMEDFVGWGGDRFRLVDLAVSVGFLRRDVSGDVPVLVCVGFKEANAGKSRSVQSMGGRATALKKHLMAAEREAAEKLELWSRTRPGIMNSIPVEMRKDSILLMRRVCRVIGMKDPGDLSLSDGTLDAVLTVIREKPHTIEPVVAWLYANRNDESIPDRLQSVFVKWDEFAESARGAE